MAISVPKFFGIGLKSMLLVVVLVGLTALILPQVERMAREVVIEHEKTDLQEETRQRAWEILDRFDMLRYDVAEAARVLEQGGELGELDRLSQRYLRIEVVSLGQDAGGAQEAALEIDAGLAERNVLDPAYGEFQQQLLASHSGGVLLANRIVLTRYQLREADAEGKQAAYFVVWGGKLLAGDAAPQAGQPPRAVMVAMAMDEAYRKLMGSSRHLGFVYQQGATDPASLATLQLLEDRQRLEFALQTGRSDAAGNGHWGVRDETPRVSLGSFRESPEGTLLSPDARFFFCETATKISLDGLPTVAIKKVEEAFRRLSSRHLSEQWEASRSGKPDLWTLMKRVSGPTLEVPRIRIFAHETALDECKREVRMVYRELMEQLDQYAASLPPSIDDGDWREAIRCQTCDVSIVGVKRDPTEESPQLVVVRAAFREELAQDLASELAAVRKLTWTWAAAAALIALVASLLITRPLQRMTAAVLAIADTEFDRESTKEEWDKVVAQATSVLPITRRDEIGTLASAFGRMACEVRDGHMRILELNQQLEARIRDRTRELNEAYDELVAANESLRLTNEKLLESQEAQKRLVFSISHDLKTPLTTIKGYCELLMHGTLTEQQREDLETIYAARERLQRLIEDILDSQKIDLRELELDIREFDVPRLIQEIAREMAPSAARKNNSLRVQCQQGIPPMRSDPDKIARILANLISNAGKFTEQGVITLAAEHERRQDEDWLVLSVVDTGIGIDPAKHDRIFQPFPKIVSKVENPEGTGLGLYNCRGYCEALGGDISFRSQLGQGAAFVARLPMSWRAHEVDRAPATESIAPVSEQDSRRLSSLRSNCVLVVDDDPEVCSLLKRFLERLGFQTITASGASEGIALAKSRRPGLITLDVLMPDQDGWSALEALQSDADTCDIPVIMVSVLDEKSRGFALGVADYVTKPIDWERLQRTVAKYKLDRRRGTALVIEDDPSLRKLAARKLHQFGWKVIEASHGQEALDQLDRATPDLILLDLIMPVMDGFDFLERLRAVDSWRTIPVIVLTAKDLTKAERSQLTGRVAQVIEKSPLALEDLQLEINRLVMRHFPSGVAANEEGNP